MTGDGESQRSTSDAAACQEEEAKGIEMEPSAGCQEAAAVADLAAKAAQIM